MSSTASIAKRSFLLSRSMVESTSRRAEPVGPAPARRKVGDRLPGDAAHRRHDQLSDALAARDGDALTAEIGEDDAHLAAIIGVDRARTVEHGEAILQRQA